jgi:hypothetical protein
MKSNYFYYRFSNVAYCSNKLHKDLHVGFPFKVLPEMGIIMLEHATLQLKFSLYYTTASTVNTLVTITQELTTDAFGVFSYVIPAAAIDNTTLLEKLYLKIDQLSAPATLFLMKKLNYVPYAMSASNGVPQVRLCHIWDYCASSGHCDDVTFNCYGVNCYGG